LGGGLGVAVLLVLLGDDPSGKSVAAGWGSVEESGWGVIAAVESIGGGVGGGVAAIAAMRPCGRPPNRAMATIAPPAKASKEDDFTPLGFGGSAAASCGFGACPL
ncbi:MAG: hypothetical protein WAK11_07140, partial [Candidatus Cybelea sp.]